MFLFLPLKVNLALFLLFSLLLSDLLLLHCLYVLIIGFFLLVLLNGLRFARLVLFCNYFLTLLCWNAELA